MKRLPFILLILIFICGCNQKHSNQAETLTNVADSTFVLSMCSSVSNTHGNDSNIETKKDSIVHDTLEVQKVDSVIEYTGDMWPALKIKRLDFQKESGWIAPLQAYVLENDIKSSGITVFYRYDRKIEGWSATCCYMPYGKDVETGDLVVRLQKGKNDVFLRVEKSSNPHSYVMKDIGWKDGEVFAFNYIVPSKNEHYPDSPLGYYTEIQFYDVDFDGDKELLINDFYRGQGGNSYSVYRIKGNEITPLNHDKWLFSNISNIVCFEKNKKEIVLKTFDGAWFALSLRFVKAAKPKGCDNVPISSSFTYILKELKEDYHHGGHSFELVEVRETAGDTIWTSKRHGNSWTTVKQIKIKEDS